MLDLTPGLGVLRDGKLLRYRCQEEGSILTKSNAQGIHGAFVSLLLSSCITPSDFAFVLGELRHARRARMDAFVSPYTT